MRKALSAISLFWLFVYDGSVWACISVWRASVVLFVLFVSVCACVAVQGFVVFAAWRSLDRAFVGLYRESSMSDAILVVGEESSGDCREEKGGCARNGFSEKHPLRDLRGLYYRGLCC